MNILILSPKVPYPPIDGGAIATLSLAQNLKDVGNNVTLLALNTSKHKADISRIPKTIIDKLNMKVVDIDTSISFFSALRNLLFSRLPYNGERFFKSNFGEKIIDVIKSENIDIVQLEGLYMALYTGIIKKHFNIPVVLRAHNLEHVIWQRNCLFEKNLLKKWYYKILSKRILKLKKDIIQHIDAIVPITEHDCKTFKEFRASVPIHVACAGINKEFINEINVPANCSSVFFIGALDWIPNQEGLKWFLESVWPKVLKKHPYEKFHIGGRNAPQWLINIFKKPGIVYHGEVDSAIKFMKQNGIMVVPLFAGSGMRIKILEGMAAGITIISTTIGVEGINARPDRDIIIADDANIFAEKICYVLENKDICKTIGDNASEFIGKHYDNLEIAGSLMDFYKSILK
ncbi:MAG: glycosyltransferase family 4 protein [Bacteroidetes bacterium]|nr:glycosyltransferase family 4 protein [Bacteroidota bacterium]